MEDRLFTGYELMQLIRDAYREGYVHGICYEGDKAGALVEGGQLRVEKSHSLDRATRLLKLRGAR